MGAFPKWVSLVLLSLTTGVLIASALGYGWGAQAQTGVDNLAPGFSQQPAQSTPQQPVQAPPQPAFPPAFPQNSTQQTQVQPSQSDPPQPVPNPQPVEPQAQPQQPSGRTIPNPQQFRALEQPNNPLSFQRAEELTNQANGALQSQNYDEAIRLLQEAFNAYNNRSNFHQEIGRVFSGINNRIAEEQRNLARDAAQLRDQTAYDLGLVYRAAGKAEESVAQLVQVLASQGPSRELGLKAYQQLLEIGFVQTPYPN
jgi:hypothetical protein